LKLVKSEEESEEEAEEEPKEKKKTNESKNAQREEAMNQFFAIQVTGVDHNTALMQLP
jgi:hypothetical protein